MADYNSSLPVRTQNNGDVVIEIADGTTPSQKAAVSAAGSVQIAGQGVAGTPAGGVLSIQGVSGGTAVPVTGSISVTDPAEGPVGSPPPADAIYIGVLVNSSAPTYSSGNMESLSLTTAGALRVDGSAVTQPVSGTVTANQGTAAALAAAWPVEITDGTNILGTSSHPVRIDPTGTTTQPVSGTVSISGTVAVTQSTSPWVDNLTQVGGAAIALGQTTMSASLPVAIASNQSAVPSNITQIGGSSPSASNSLAVQISTGSSYVSASNPLPVTIDPAAAGTPKNYYTDSSSIAVGSTATQSTTAGGSTGFYLQSILLSGSGKFKAVVSIGGTPYFAAFNSTAQPSVVIPVPNNTLVATGTVISVAMTNNDLAAQDLYSTLIGFQV